MSQAHKRLLANIRVTLASLETTLSLEDLAERAELMAEGSSSSESMAAMTSLEEVSRGELNQLRSDVADLKKLLQIFAATSRKKASSSQERKRPTGSTVSVSNLCCYHYRFGEAARKCTPPCSQAGNFRARC